MTKNQNPDFELKNRDQTQSYEVSERWEWVERYEKEGLIDKEIFELLQIYKESNENEDKVKALERLKELYLDRGNVDKALECTDILINLEPENPIYFREKGLILEETEEFDEAREVYIKGYESTGDKKFLAYIKDLEASTDLITPPESDGLEEELFPHSPGDAYKVIDLFSGREGVFAKQWVSQTGDTGYTPVYEALTPNIVQQHFNGSITVGVYQIKLDNTVSFIAFDVDIKKDVYEEVVSSPERFESAINNCKKAVKEIVNILAQNNINSYIEFSGNKGFHVWVFLDSPLMARIARHFAIEVIKRVSIEDGVSVEAFPKQSFVRENKLGNLIKIPYGFHLKTGKQSYFVDGNFKKIKDQRQYLHSMKKVSKGVIVSAIANFETENVYLSNPSKTQISKENETVNPFEDEEFLPERDEELQRVLSGCPVLKTIYQKALNENPLSAQEVNVIKYTLGCLTHGVEIVNYAFKKAGVEEDKFLKSKLNGNPTSCEKIRTRVSDIVSSVECSCVFDKEKYTYATPNIYAKENPEFGQPSLDILGFERLFNQYLKLKREVLKIQKQIGEIEKKINTLFEQAGVDRINLPQGVLVREKNENGEVKFKFEIE